MIRFIIVPFLPVVLLVLACLFGGVWSVLALLGMTAWVMGLDRLLPASSQTQRTDALAHRISAALGGAHFCVALLGLWALTAPAGLHGAAAVLTAIALGLFFGQVSNSNAHELIHRSDRAARRLGVAVYTSLLFGHHASAHPKVHHVYVATPKDPNSAPLGMSFYRFWPRAWLGSFRAGWQAENRMRAKATGDPGLHPYVAYIGGAAVTLLVAFAIGGIKGVLVWLALAVYAQMQLILSDYVQHYGLQRRPDGAGGWEPAGPQHSWNAGHWYSSALMLNAPRHSDHHQNPARAFPELQVTPGAMPMLPYSLPVMGAIALVPPVWRRMMDKRARRWSAAPVVTPTDANVTDRALGSV